MNIELSHPDCVQYKGTPISGEEIIAWAPDYDIFFSSVGSPFHQTLVIRKDAADESPYAVYPDNYVVRLPTGGLMNMQPSEYREYLRVMQGAGSTARRISSMPFDLHGHVRGKALSTLILLDVASTVFEQDWGDLTLEARRLILDRFLAVCMLHYTKAKSGTVVVVPSNLCSDSGNRRYRSTVKA